MIISLGYIKDLLAFISSIILIIIFYVFKVNVPKQIIPLCLLGVFLIDGLFSIHPSLHNYSINI